MQDDGEFNLCHYPVILTHFSQTRHGPGLSLNRILEKASPVSGSLKSQQ